MSGVVHSNQGKLAFKTLKFYWCEGNVESVCAPTCNVVHGMFNRLLISSFFYITYIGMSCRESASHTHVSALLHALVALTPSHFAPSTSMLPSGLSYLSLLTSATSVVGRFLGRGKRTHRGCFSETCFQQRAEEFQCSNRGV